MGYGIVCGGYRGYDHNWQCDWRKDYDGISDIPQSHYDKYCTKDYEGDGYSEGYGSCTYYKYHCGRCYITTAVCDTIGLKCDNVFLFTINSFRDKLEQNPKMFKQLEIYDIVGPIIANAINGDKDVATYLFNFSISPVCTDIINGDYNSALFKYTNMTKKLIEKYRNSVSIGLDVFKMSSDIGHVKYGNQYRKSLNFGEPFRRYKER